MDLESLENRHLENNIWLRLNVDSQHWFAMKGRNGMNLMNFFNNLLQECTTYDREKKEWRVFV